MRLERGATLALCTAALALTVASCRREERRYRETPPAATPPGTVRLSPLQPGEPLAAPHLVSGYDENAYAVSQGQRLFNWYNCSGCHANGGGGMGPPLIDDEWIYGSAPENIHETIVEGRPNGMPSFGGKIPDAQIWQIVAYVRSLSGLTPASTRSARTEHMMYAPGSQALPRKPTPPKPSFEPPASQQP